MESAEHKLKRLKMRSWRRGTKEMDLILGPFADEDLQGLGPDELASYEELLNENDQDLYQWISNQTVEPIEFTAIIDRLRSRLNP